MNNYFINLSGHNLRGLINKIYINSLPSGLYELTLNGMSLLKTTSGIIDFSAAQKSNDLQQIQNLDIIKQVAISPYEPNLPNRNDFLNLERVDDIRLICPNNLIYKPGASYIIKLVGLFDDYRTGNWISNTKFITVKIEH